MPEAYLIQGLSVASSTVTTLLREHGITVNRFDDPFDIADLANKQLRSNKRLLPHDNDFGVYYNPERGDYILGFSLGKGVEIPSGDYYLSKIVAISKLKSHRDFIDNFAVFGFTPNEITDQTNLFLLVL